MEKNKHIDFLGHYEPVHEQFSKYCRAISGNSDDAEDLMQDTILNVLEKYSAIRDLTVFKSYLFSVASNLHKKKMRRNKFQANFNEEEISQIIDHGQNQEHLTDFQIVYEKILSLPNKTAEALILFHISDLSLEEIRILQGGSLSGVKSRLQRGREKILTLLNSREQVKIALILFTL